LDVRDENPGRCAGNGRFEVLGQSAASSEPGECALDEPSSRQNFETIGAIRTLDDFEGHLPIAASAPRSLSPE
jgi:hypothetical protein